MVHEHRLDFIDAQPLEPACAVGIAAGNRPHRVVRCTGIPGLAPELHGPAVGSLHAIEPVQVLGGSGGSNGVAVKVPNLGVISAVARPMAVRAASRPIG